MPTEAVVDAQLDEFLQSIRMTHTPKALSLARSVAELSRSAETDRLMTEFARIHPYHSGLELTYLADTLQFSFWVGMGNEGGRYLAAPKPPSGYRNGLGWEVNFGENSSRGRIVRVEWPGRGIVNPMSTDFEVSQIDRVNQGVPLLSIVDEVFVTELSKWGDNLDRLLLMSTNTPEQEALAMLYQGVLRHDPVAAIAWLA